MTLGFIRDRGTIHLNYTVLDKYGNVVEYYPSKVEIQLISEELKLNRKETIGVFGSSRQCNECSEGSYSITSN